MGKSFRRYEPDQYLLLPPDLRNPRQWLELITQLRATFTVSPDFGYRNCVRNVRDASDLDLTSLKAALSGAEPVRASTITGFEDHFGLKNIIAPCYGLAEATLAVAVHPVNTPIRLDPSGRFVSSGVPCRGVSVRIVPRAEDGPPVALAANVKLFVLSWMVPNEVVNAEYKLRVSGGFRMEMASAGKERPTVAPIVAVGDKLNRMERALAVVLTLREFDTPRLNVAHRSVPKVERLMLTVPAELNRSSAISDG